MNIRRSLPALVSTAAVLAGSGSSALAADSPTPGQHVSACAHAGLGQRGNPPLVTCNDGGFTMTFANFGEMVQHMRSADG